MSHTAKALGAYESSADAMRPADGVENNLAFRTDARGHATALRIVKKGQGDFMAFLDATRERYLIDPADIVMPAGWTLNEDGSATKTVEHDGEVKAVLTTQHIELSSPAVRPSRPSAASTEREST